MSQMTDTQQTLSTAPWTPDSAYASWSDCAEWIEAADRMEREFNGRRSAALALADEERHHTVRGATDDGLKRLAKVYGRELEDVREGLLPGGNARERLTLARLHDIECEQELRAALAESWLAREDGTHSYTAFHGRGGLEAVLNYGAPAPSYDLALQLDYEHFRRGLVHVLNWQEAATRVTAALNPGGAL